MHVEGLGEGLGGRNLEKNMAQIQNKGTHFLLLLFLTSDFVKFVLEYRTVRSLPQHLALKSQALNFQHLFGSFLPSENLTLTLRISILISPTQCQ